MRKDIVIEVVTSEPNSGTYGKHWESLDTYADQQITLQFISNLLTGVESITSSSTLSVKLPRTVRNDRIFDLATRPQHQSSMTHRKIECRVYINGIDMMKAAYCYLLDCESDNYQVAIVFGLLQNYGQWIDAAKSLKDLQDEGQSVVWDIWSANTNWSGNDANINTYTPQNGIGKLMYYGIYNPGFERDGTTIGYANVHPFVTMREIWERIINENDLDFVLPQSVLLDMEDLAIVLTTISGNTPQGNTNNDNSTMASQPYSLRKSMAAVGWFWNPICTTTGECYENGEQNYNIGNTKSRIVYKGDGKSVDLSIYLALQDNTSFPYNGTNRTVSHILDDKGHMSYMNLCVYIYATGETKTITPILSHTFGILWNGNIHIPCGTASEGEAVADIWIENDIRICNDVGNNIFNLYWFGGNRTNWDAMFTWNQSFMMVVRYYTGTHDYPNPAFRCFPNLPDIRQLDFVKFVCQLYCLFPVVGTSDESIQFVPFDTLQDNTFNAYDWSDKLLEQARDVPDRISFRIGDYAKRNIIAYREDDNDPVSDNIRTGILGIDDDTLDKEKDLIEFPLAASEGDYIGQYTIHQKEDDSEPPVITYEAEFTECVHRLMRVTEWYDQIHKKVTRLGFANLSVPYIISTYYATYQGAIAQPRIITEHIRLNELEMRDVDFRRPVYLSKYGRYFAIKQIQWTVGDEYAEVELLLLGAANQQIIN